VFTWLRHSNGPLPMQSAVYLYINNLSSKITTQNRYSINVIASIIELKIL